MRVLSTLLYHSIFDYPLTIGEIHRYLISDRTVSLPALKEEISSLLKTGKILSNGELFIPSSIVNRPSSLVLLRQRRNKISQKKLAIAKRASGLISIIPWVKLVAITGALAMENTDDNDDIDLMVITSKNRLWIIRPLVFLLVSLFFSHRRPLPNAKTNNQQLKTHNNEICLNLWLDESALAIPLGQRNLYTAHELAQMKPIVNKDGIYEKMMAENIWGKKYLANAWNHSNHSNHSNHFSLFNLLNLLAFNLQFQFMKSKMTNERVSIHAAFFHPGNRADTILSAYDRLCHRSF